MRGEMTVEALREEPVSLSYPVVCMDIVIRLYRVPFPGLY